MSLIIASLIVALLLGEAMVRIVMPQDLRFNVTQWDEFTGFWHIPNIKGYTKHRDYTMLVTINSNGLRDKEYPYIKPPRTIRIGVFGDSFTFGEGVQNDETYSSVLEKIFQEDPTLEESSWTVEVINFGVGKTGTSHQYALYIKEGYKYDLDIVVLGFLGGNDFTDNIQGVFNLSDGILVHDPAAYSSVRTIQKIVYKIPFYRWLASNSHLVNLARIAATRSDDRARGGRFSKQNNNGDGYSPGTDLSIDPYIFTEVLVNAFKNRVANDNENFIFMNLPSKNQALTNNFSGMGTVPDYIVWTNNLLQTIGRNNYNVLDLVPVFSKLEVDNLYFRNDGHMNSVGHRIIATQLKQYLSPYILDLITSK